MDLPICLYCNTRRVSQTNSRVCIDRQCRSSYIRYYLKKKEERRQQKDGRCIFCSRKASRVDAYTCSSPRCKKENNSLNTKVWLQFKGTSTCPYCNLRPIHSHSKAKTCDTLTCKRMRLRKEARKRNDLKLRKLWVVKDSKCLFCSDKIARVDLYTCGSNRCQRELINLTARRWRKEQKNKLLKQIDSPFPNLSLSREGVKPINMEILPMGKVNLQKSFETPSLGPQQPCKI